MEKPLFRWTIGESTPDGREALRLSVASFLRFYDADVVICHNADPEPLGPPAGRLYDQRQKWDGVPAPAGVAWKLYPPRLAPGRHEVSIDNDVILADRVPQLDEFLKADCTLLLEGDSRTYGRFHRHVPPGYQVNSGVYGMPPGFDLDRFVKVYGGESWEKNALGEHDKSETFDEQGLVAFALLSHPRHVIIPSTSITNCEHRLVPGRGYHFIGLNRRAYHGPFRQFKWATKKTYL